MVDGLKIDDCIKKWDDLSIEDKSLVADALIERIEISDKSINITWR